MDIDQRIAEIMYANIGNRITNELVLGILASLQMALKESAKNQSIDIEET